MVDEHLESEFLNYNKLMQYFTVINLWSFFGVTRF
jgi:hypothetical protein